jgi:signal transduction histidine kinase
MPQSIVRRSCRIASWCGCAERWFISLAETHDIAHQSSGASDAQTRLAEALAPDRVQLQQVTLNLVLNAVEAMEEEGNCSCP